MTGTTAPADPVTDPQRAWSRLLWSRRAWGWWGPLLVACAGFMLRVWHLSRPNRLQFDETYYAKDAWSMLRFGFPREWIDKADERIIDHQFDGLFTGQPEQFVHPPAGKWFIAAGEQIFGLNAFGWRIAAAVTGALTLFVLARLVIRLTGSVVMGCLAGSVLALDGLHFVLSRLALLDVFLTFWLVCAVACLAADRDWIAARLRRWRPWRPWQLAAGACFGLACATKWSGVYPVAAFGLAIVGWEVLARYRAARHEDGLPWRGWIGTTLTVGVPAFVLIVGMGFVVYIATWTSWLIHYDVFAEQFGHGYGDHPSWGAWVNEPASTTMGHVVDALRSLWHYHVMTYDFHTGSYLRGKSHPYESGPAGWLVLSRPVAVDAQNDLPAASCGAAADSSCMREVLMLGNPVVWWSGVLAIIAGIVTWFRTRNWAMGWALLAIAATWLPWFAFMSRPIFSFYAVTVLPFTIVVMCLLVHAVYRSAPSPRARYGLWLAAGAWCVAVVVAFWYFYPIWTDALIPYDAWRQRMWFSTWI